MATTSATTATPRRAARLLAALLVAVLALATLAALPAPRAAGAGDRAERWAGFRIPSTGRAAGGWIGGYRLGGTPVFVITPGRRPNRAGFRPAAATADLRGAKAPSLARTRRAAWILSKYGGHRDAVQAAAVDAAVLHLLGGRTWRLGRPRGSARVRNSGDPGTVRRYARLMLGGSRASAGPYAVRVQPTVADVGGVTAVTVRVTDGHGGPVAGLPVSVTSPDGGTSQPVAGPVEAVTGDDGRALVRLAAPLAGWRTVVAEVGQVPLHWLRVRAAARGRQASVAEGGVRRTLTASARVAVRGPQSLTIAADPNVLVAGSPARVVATVDGDGSRRGATASLHGPFASVAEAHCDGPAVGTASLPVEGDGAYASPAITPSVGGRYLWRVAVDGSDATVPVASCGAPVRVRGRSTVAVSAPATAAPFDVVSTQVSLAGLPFGGPVDVTTSLYGPYDTAGQACTGNHRDVVQRRPGNGTFTSLSFQVEERGWYAWRASVPEGDLWLGSSSTCGAVGSLTQVQ
ncbi:hypothetical protein [Nocardioides furvisabuli]|uniref:hypothetical protein n=1 Tax=Nocardioides furvisabuli TaxID=375542 RepID=UPI001E5BD61C|nr:hypothetical protein [Nocardioides furvisabuli]